ncbi:MAG: hypothetical protein V1750_06115 [Acidobacteriota bacterium]
MDAPLSLERAWVGRWREAGPALARQHRLELRRISDEEALAATEAPLSLVECFPLDE